jgi:hypothetical protein
VASRSGETILRGEFVMDIPTRGATPLDSSESELRVELTIE